MNYATATILFLAVLLSGCQTEDHSQTTESLQTGENSQTNFQTNNDSQIPQDLVGVWRYPPETEETYISIRADGTWNQMTKENVDKSRECFWHEDSKIEAIDGNQYRYVTDEGSNYVQEVYLSVQDDLLTMAAGVPVQLPRAEFAEESHYTPICEEQLTMGDLSGVWHIRQDNSVDTYLSIHSSGTFTEYVYDQSDFGSGKTAIGKQQAPFAILAETSTP